MTFIKNKNYLNLGKGILAVLILFFLSRSSQIDFKLLISIIHKPLYFMSCICIFFVIVAIGAWRWYQLNLAQQITMSYKQTVIQSYLGTAFNNLLPGSVGGDAIRCYYVFKLFPNRKSAILTTILFDRIIGLLGIFSTICLMTVMHMSILFQKQEIFYLLSLISCGFLILFSGLLAIMLIPERFSLHNLLLRILPHNKLTLLLVNYLDAFRKYRTPKSVFFKCLASSILMQMLIVIALMLIAKMMDLPLMSFSNYAIAVGITLLVNLIPITPGGVGIGEMAFAKLLLVLNPAGAIPYATIYLCYRMLSLLSYLPALIFYLPVFNKFLPTVNLQGEVAQDVSK